MLVFSLVWYIRFWYIVYKWGSWRLALLKTVEFVVKVVSWQWKVVCEGYCLRFHKKI
jgi:hypothetical protein